MNKLQTWWAEVRSSIWLLPTLLTLCAIGLAFLTLWLDRTTLAGLQASRFWWLFGGGAEGARGVLSAIASGIITVTGVVFSITIVALQLASSQFTPRVLRNFTSDLASQVVLGVFIGTFTYTLLIERAVRSRNEGSAEFIPSFSITISIILAVVSIGFLIFFIHHIARSIQASVLIDRVVMDTLERIDKNFPEMFGEPAARGVEWRAKEVHDGGAEDSPRDDPEVAQSGAEEAGLGLTTVPIRAHEGGYLQSVDEDALFDLAERDRLVVRMVQQIGDFVLPGSILALAGPEDTLSDTCQDNISRAFILGLERSPFQDVEYGIIELMDIAVKALSPGINDPTTANMCIDRLGEILVRLGQREPPVAVRTGESGALRFIARRGTFDRAVHLAFDQTRHYGAHNPVTASKMIETLGKVAELIPEERRAPLKEEALLVLQLAQATIGNRADLARVEAAAATVLKGVVDESGADA